MILELLRKKNIQLPDIETEDGLTTKEIMGKMRSFYRKFEKNGGEFSDSAFFELFLNYPKSICSRHMTETAKELVTILYLDSKPEREKRKDQKEIKRLEKRLEDSHSEYYVTHQIEERIANLKNSDYWLGYSYEDLAIMFDRSKATIHEAIRQKKTQVKAMLQEAYLRDQAKAIALAEMVKEEKLKLLQK